MIERMGKPPEKLKSYHDDQAEHLRGGGYRRGVSMQRYCVHCMHKVHRSYKYTVQRRDGVVFVVGVVVVAVVEGDSCVKKEESAATELNRRGTVK
jgi:hypothetical protein